MECYWKRGSNDWTVCCSPCLAVTFKPGISFRCSFSYQSWHCQVLSAAIWCLFQWHSQLVTFRFVLKFTYLLQSEVFISRIFSCQAFTLTGSHLFLWQVEESICSHLSSTFSTFPAFSRLSLPVSLVPSSYRQFGSAVKQDLCHLLYSAYTC